jgi:hypothetical protein
MVDRENVALPFVVVSAAAVSAASARQFNRLEFMLTDLVLSGRKRRQKVVEELMEAVDDPTCTMVRKSIARVM